MEHDQVVDGFLYVVGELAPIIILEIQEAIAQGQDIKSINWRSRYGRSIAELEAQVNAKQAGA